MKKSKIIIPALALLAFTSISTVSGTVAWFTANRGATFTASTFEVVSADGNLKRSLAAGVATKMSGEADVGNIVVQDTAGTQNKLSDASYDIVSGGSNIWTDIPNDDGSEATKFEQKAYATAISTNVYYAADWTCTYTYTFGADTNDINLYLDINAAISGFGHTKTQTGTAELYTYKGFRLAMMTQETTPIKRVVAPAQVKAKCTYVDTATPTVTSGKPAYKAYTDSQIMGTDHGLTKIEASTAGGTDRNDYFFTFTKSNPSVTIKFVAWFEGSDENIVSGAEMDTVTMSIPFYTRLAA